jgi:biopolymer transport protein ExbB
MNDAARFSKRWHTISRTLIHRSYRRDLSALGDLPEVTETPDNHALAKKANPVSCSSAQPPPYLREYRALFSLIQAAGWPVWLLFLTSIAAVALIVERWLSLRRDKILPPRLLDDVLSLHRNRQITPDLIQRLERSSALGRVFASGLRHETGPREIMKEAMEEAGRSVAHELERYLGALGTIATIAPLMGLFGTVIGMIEIFGSQAPTGTNPQQLAHGISVALYNTAFGLIVAIPAMIAYRFYRSKVDDTLVEMEQQSLRLVDMLRSEGSRSGSR